MTPAIRFESVASFERCTTASRIAFARSHTVSRSIPIFIVFAFFISGLLAVDRSPKTPLMSAVFWFFLDFAIFYTIVFTFAVWNAFVARPKSLWTVAQTAPLATAFVFDTAGVTASNTDRTLAHRWSAYEYFIDVPGGILLIYRTKGLQYFTRAELGDSYGAFAELVRAHVPGSAVFRERRLVEPRAEPAAAAATPSA